MFLLQTVKQSFAIEITSSCALADNVFKPLSISLNHMSVNVVIESRFLETRLLGIKFVQLSPNEFNFYLCSIIQNSLIFLEAPLGVVEFIFLVEKKHNCSKLRPENLL